MTKQELEERLAALEKRVAELEEARAQGVGKWDWLRTVGMFTGDEEARKMDEKILEAREKEREEARRRPLPNPRRARKQRKLNKDRT